MMLPRGARSDNSAGPQHPPPPVEERVSGHGELPLPRSRLGRLLKAPRSFLHLLTVHSFAVPSRSPFAVRCEPLAPGPVNCRRGGEGLAGAAGDHPLALRWMLNLMLAHLCAQPTQPSLFSLHLDIAGS